MITEILVVLLLCAGVGLTVSGVAVLFGLGWALIAGGACCGLMVWLLARGLLRG